MNDPRDPDSLYEEIDETRSFKPPLPGAPGGFRLVYTCPSCGREWAYLPAARFHWRFPVTAAPAKGSIKCAHIECGGALLNLEDLEAERMAAELARGDIPSNVKPKHRQVFLAVLDHGPITRDALLALLAQSDHTRVSMATVHRHLHAMLEQHIIQRTRVGYFFHYQVVTPH